MGADGRPYRKRARSLPVDPNAIATREQNRPEARHCSLRIVILPPGQSQHVRSVERPGGLVVWRLAGQSRTDTPP